MEPFHKTKLSFKIVKRFEEAWEVSYLKPVVRHKESWNITVNKEKVALQEEREYSRYATPDE